MVSRPGPTQGFFQNILSPNALFETLSEQKKGKSEGEIYEKSKDAHLTKELEAEQQAGFWRAQNLEFRETQNREVSGLDEQHKRAKIKKTTEFYVAQNEKETGPNRSTPTFPLSDSDKVWFVKISEDARWVKAEDLEIEETS
jgi:hypothetical protein